MGLMSYKNSKILLFRSVLLAAVLFFAGEAYADQSGQSEALTVHPQALERAGIYNLRRIDPSLTGEQTNIALISRSLTYLQGQPQNDYQPDIGHNAFLEQDFEFYHDSDIVAGFSSHTTAVCSILFANDSAAYNDKLGVFEFEGIIPEGQGHIFEFWHFLKNNIFPQQAPEADVIAASMGTQFEDWWTRGFDAMAQNTGIPIIAGIGNGLAMHDPPLYPAAGANVIAVGVANSVDSSDKLTKLKNFALPDPRVSTTGPTADNRVKPDIVAPGNCLAADVNEPWQYSATGSYSSYSTPIVAGTIALLMQTARQYDDLAPLAEDENRNCLVKAILLNSAEKLPFWNKGYLGDDDKHLYPLDFAQGAGMLDATAAYYQLLAGQHKPGDVPAEGWDIDTLNPWERPLNYYRFVIDEPENKTITITLNWNKHYSPNYPFEALPEKDANLALYLWAIDPYDSSNDYLLDYSDSIHDNLEHIHIPADPDFFEYEIIVTYNENDTTEAEQPYAIAWNIAESNDRDNILWYDLNADGKVDNLDLSILINNMAKSRNDKESYLIGDITGEGKIDINDAKALIDNFGRKAPWHPDYSDIATD